MTAEKVGMHSLPTELKEHIVRCCADQDALLASALAEVRRDRDAATKKERTRLCTVRRAAVRYRSLAALAAVSREWNELVAPALFEARCFQINLLAEGGTTLTATRANTDVAAAQGWQ